MRSKNLNFSAKIDKIEAWVDTDFAGCRRTRKSTSGGILRLGEHNLKGWSTTQDIIALSSGEAEYYGMVNGASMAMRSIMGDMGVELGITIKTDAAAAKGICVPSGVR